MRVVIWHNPRCSKSRDTLALLEARGVKPEIVRYLETPPSAAEILIAARQLGVSVRKMIRSKEESYRALGLDNARLTDAELADTLAAHPVLIERPVVFARGKAVIGRPPEAVLPLIRPDRRHTHANARLVGSPVDPAAVIGVKAAGHIRHRL
jgi:arsenate reductase